MKQYSGTWVFFVDRILDIPDCQDRLIHYHLYLIIKPIATLKIDSFYSLNVLAVAYFVTSELM